MKTSLSAFAFTALFCAGTMTAHAQAPAAAPIPEIPGMKLVWNDEFDKEGMPDASKWNFEKGFVRNKEPQLYTESNARVEGGLLVIEARKERVANPYYVEGSTDWRTNQKFADYTSSSLTTKNKIGWTTGHFEMRARIDTRTSSWPAFWMVGRDRPWPHNGEIDIMEYYNSGLLANFVWGNGIWNSKTKPIKNFAADWSSQFHVWAMDWDEKQISLSCDGEVLNKQDLAKTVNNDKEAFNPFTAPQFILVNQAIGHGDPNKITFPLVYEVDYVRVYQKEGAGQWVAPTP